MGKIIIRLDQRWELQDFAVLTKEYLQLYGIFYALSLRKSETKESMHRSGYAAMPWEGGHSVVNFIRSVYSFIPEEKRPIVREIKYASPGFIELSVVVDVALQIAAIVSSMSGSILAVNKAYHTVMRDYRRREWAKLKSDKLRLQNNEREIKLIIKAAKLLKDEMGIDDEQHKALMLLAGSDELVQLKMLLAIYRRALPLAELEESGKAKF
ncbi:hypothetical protein [Siccibacter turicensis]|uniref:hypothetical protein n=1 Tax=Siccibacter turicensis TaxID=357233 RepID=UPI0023F1E181|nr:hypothetical protein [Siccibacter turicensis]